MVTSLTPHTLRISHFGIFKPHTVDIRNIIPAAIDCGVLSQIKLFVSTFLETNLDRTTSSYGIPTLLENRSMNELGRVAVSVDFCETSTFRSIFCRIFIAFEHPFVALCLSKLNISAISNAVLGHPFNLHEM
jgi:hypothetical protein